MKQVRSRSTKLYNNLDNPRWFAPAFITFLFMLFGGAFFVSLTGTLDQMTARDCRLGVQAACEELKR